MQRLKFLIILFFSLLLIIKFISPAFSDENNEAWSGLYIKGKKSGHSVISVRKVDNGYVINENVEMRFKAMNSLQKIITATQINTNNDFMMKSFTCQIKSAAATLIVEGGVVNSKLHIKTVSAGVKQETAIPLKSHPFLSANIVPNLFKKGIKKNTRYKLSIFDPSTLNLDEMTVELIEIEKKKIGNRVEEINHLKGTYKGMEMHTWVDKDGIIIKEESPMGMIILKEPKEIALGKISEGELVDIIDVTAIISNIEIKEPSKVKYLKARLSGVNLNDFKINDERQRLIPLTLPSPQRGEGTFSSSPHRGEDKGEGGIIEIRSEDLDNLNTQSLPINKKGLEPYLTPTPYIQSNDSEIISIAKDIIGNEKDSLRAARLINNWVYKNIEKKPVVSIPSAKDVLKMREGDCNEHTTLFVAISRAVKIPARINVGIVHLGGRFFYHAWPEVYVGRWVAVDPTLNQFPADATHIRFVTGDLDKQIEIMNIINKLKIEIKTAH